MIRAFLLTFLTLQLGDSRGIFEPHRDRTWFAIRAYPQPVKTSWDRLSELQLATLSAEISVTGSPSPKPQIVILVSCSLFFGPSLARLE